MVKFIVFSRDRPLQLHAYLSSFFRLVTGAEVACIVHAQGAYSEGYMAVEREFPGARFIYETNFPKHTAELVETGDYFCFGCDDVVFIQPVDCSLAEGLLNEQDLIGVSLRMGTRITVGMFGATMQHPEFETLPNDMMAWTMGEYEIFNPWATQQDWCYPWEVLGSIYTRQFVMDMWPHVAPAPNPSLFEEYGAKMWTEVTKCRRYASWTKPRILNPTINVTSTVSSNGVLGGRVIDPSLLLDCWNAGIRMDTQRYAEKEYDSWRVGDLFLSRV